MPGTLPYLLKGQAAPLAVQEADWVGTMGAVNPTSGQWDTTIKPVVNDPSVRQALAMAVNRSTYFRVIDDGVGALADGIFRKSSPFYKNPGYPAYNPTKAKALIDAYKSKNGVTEVAFVMDIVAGSATETKPFDFFQQEFAKIGVTITLRSLGPEHAHQQRDLRRVRLCDLEPVRRMRPVAQLRLVRLPAGDHLTDRRRTRDVRTSGRDPDRRRRQLRPPGRPRRRDGAVVGHGGARRFRAQKTAWQTVNRRFAIEVPYVMLDTTVNAWAARSNVQNWVSGTAGDGTTRCLSPDAGSARWDQIWKELVVLVSTHRSGRGRREPPPFTSRGRFGDVARHVAPPPQGG